jgi:amino acid transporter
MQKVNARHMPVAILIVQGVVFSVVCSVFLVMPSVSSSFWILADLTAMLALSCYVFIFAAAIRLRYSHPQIKRAYKVPFGNVGMWVVCLSGISVSLFTVLIGFVPPSQIDVGNIKFYELFLITGFVGFYLFPLIIYRLRKRSWGVAGKEMLKNLD